MFIEFVSKVYHARNQIISDISDNPSEFISGYDSWGSSDNVSYGLRLDDGVPRHTYGDGSYDMQKGEIPLLFEGEDMIHGFFVNMIGDDYEKRLENIKSHIMKADLFFEFHTEKESKFEALVYEGSWDTGNFERLTFDEINEKLSKM